MIALVFGVIFLCLINLNSWVLGVYLSLDETLQRFWYPRVETYLPIDRSYLKTEMFLLAATHAQFFFVAQNTVQTGKQLFGRKLGLVIGTRYLKHEQCALHLDGVIDSLIVAPR